MDLSRRLQLYCLQAQHSRQQDISNILEEIKFRHKISVENSTPKKILDVTLVAEDYQYIQGHKVIFEQNNPNKVQKKKKEKKS